MLKLNFLRNITFKAFITYSLLAMPIAYANVLTSIKPIGFIASAITANVTTTQVLLPDGSSPHNYSPKPSDLVKLKSADLVIWVGEDLEVFLPSLLKSVKKNKRIELTAFDAIKKRLRKDHGHEHEHDHDHNHDHDHDHHHGEFDMHIWLSPNMAEDIAKIIHDKLIQIYPKQKKQLAQNLANFKKQLKETKQIIAKKLNPVQNKGYFVFHDAYGYFESTFDLNNVGHFTVNPAVQPGFKKINEIQKKLKNKNAVCVFKEPQFSPTVINKLVKGTDVKVGELDPLGMNMTVSNQSYNEFLLNLTQQYLDCLK